MTAHAAALALFFAAAPPEALHRWVTDEAKALSPVTRESLEARLGAYEQQTGHQVVVYVARSTGGEPIEDFAVRSFKQWKIGRPEVDDGVAIFVFTQDHTARIEVGYGVEDMLTDAASSRILRERLIPKMQAGDVDGAVNGTVDAVLHKLGTGEAPSQVHKARLAAWVIGILLFIVLAIWQPQLAWLLLMILTGRRRGNGGGGGFAGGGGRSGGAGASGRW
jgi:uncharacterized protein